MALHQSTYLINIIKMKAIILVLILFNTIIGYSQDTTNLIKNNDGSTSFWLTTKSDTMLISTYPNGKKETERCYKNKQITGIYKRWYENGKLMWQKNLINNIEDGKAVFYNDKGVKITELIYKKGIIKDTLFIKKNIHLVLGKITYSSKIYGGVQRPDGGSNISESSDPYQNFKMYAVKVDSILKPKLIQYFKSDHDGQFMVLVPKGKIGFYPASIKLKDIKPGEYCPPTKAFNAGQSGWDMRQPLVVKNESLIKFSLNNYSVGYAP